LTANGFQVVLTSEPTPTPAVSYAVKAQDAAGGVMITASHNPPSFNGFKLKADFGGSAEPSMCQAIEALLDRNPVRAAALTSQTAVTDIRPAHYAAVKKLVDFKAIARSKIKFAHDPLFGVGAGCFEQAAGGHDLQGDDSQRGARSEFRRINPEPVEKNYARSAAYLKKHPHDLCLVTDGDADPRWRDGRTRQLSFDAQSHLFVTPPYGGKSQGEGANDQGPHDDFNDRQDVQKIRH
jgi:phosphomannomutase